MPKASAASSTAVAVVAPPVDPKQVKLDEAKRRSAAFKEKIQREIADLRRAPQLDEDAAATAPQEPHLDRFTVRPPVTAVPVDMYAHPIVLCCIALCVDVLISTF
jgi:hypothetical protein